METSLTNFIVSVLNGELIENMFFELSCKDPEHEKFKVPYKKLYRAICPNCSRILRSLYYQDYVNEAQIRGAKFKFSESEFMERINDELNKPREEQVKFSRILFPFICNKHGEFFTNKDRINEGYWCPDCYFDSRRLSYEQAVSRGKDYNFILETPKNDYEKINDPSKQNLIWSCIYHPDYKVNSRPDEYNLDLVYCPICSGGQITNERILRYLFSRIFNKDYCEKPTLLIDILDFDKVKHLLPKDYNSLKSYSHMHFDAHIYLNFIFNGKNYSLSVAGEYWDREHTSPEEYGDRFKDRTPRLGDFFEDYLHLKSSDNFKKELKNRKIIDILIIIDHNLNRDGFQDFIIEEFESQFKEIFNEPNFKLRNFPRYNWRDLKVINRNRQIFGDIKRFI